MCTYVISCSSNSRRGFLRVLGAVPLPATPRHVCGTLDTPTAARARASVPRLRRLLLHQLHHQPHPVQHHVPQVQTGVPIHATLPVLPEPPHQEPEQLHLQVRS